MKLDIIFVDRQGNTVKDKYFPDGHMPKHCIIRQQWKTGPRPDYAMMYKIVITEPPLEDGVIPAADFLEPIVVEENNSLLGRILKLMWIPIIMTIHISNGFTNLPFNILFKQRINNSFHLSKRISSIYRYFFTTCYNYRIRSSLHASCGSFC